MFFILIIGFICTWIIFESKPQSNKTKQKVRSNETYKKINNLSRDISVDLSKFFK